MTNTMIHMIVELSLSRLIAPMPKGAEKRNMAERTARNRRIADRQIDLQIDRIQSRLIRQAE